MTITITLPEQGPCYLDRPSHGVYRKCLELILRADGARVSVCNRQATSTPIDEYHARTRCVILLDAGQFVDLDYVRQMFAPGGELAALAARVVAGMGEEWNGSNNVGTLTDDARAALEALDDWVAKDGRTLVAEGWTYWDVRDWLEPVRHEIRADMTDADLAAWSEDAEHVAKADQVVLDGPVLDWAEKVRDEKREAIRDRLIEEAGEEPAYWPDEEDLYENDGGWLEWLPTAQAWLGCSGQPTSRISLLYGSPSEGFEWQNTGLRFADFSCWGRMVEHFDGEGSDD